MEFRIHSILRIAFALLLVAGTFSTAYARQQGLSNKDKKFLMKAAQGGIMEVDLAHIASSKATDPEVRKFASHIAQDHTAANDQLRSLAQEKGMVLPNTMGRKDQKDVNKLSLLPSSRFNQAYMSFMVKDHQKDIKEFSKEASQGTDPDVKSFAAQMMPKLEHHLNMASSVDRKLTGKA